MASGSQTKGPNLVSMPADWTLSGEGENAPGTDPIINVTESARAEVRRLVELEGQPGLRLGIKGGGCSGLSYHLEFTDAREGDKKNDPRSIQKSGWIAGQTNTNPFSNRKLIVSDFHRVLHRPGKGSRSH